MLRCLESKFLINRKYMTELEKNNLKKELLEKHDISANSVNEILRQLTIFEKGIPFIQLIRPCKINDGIKVLDLNQKNRYLEEYSKAVDTKLMLKFVPASGAASRMFKSLQATLAADNQITLKGLVEQTANGNFESKAVLEFINNIEKLAFYDELKEIMSVNGLNLDKLKKEGKCLDIIRYTIEHPGLNSANRPKGSIKFHKYADGARTSFEEHIIEALNYAYGKDKIARIHFTISPEHSQLVHSIISFALEKQIGRKNKTEVSYSFQKPSTNTLAVTIDNKPFRDGNGKILFRPGGHGALLENLNDLDADIIFIKNIDNVAPDHLKAETYNYKKILCGLLIELQNKVFSYLALLENSEADISDVNEIKEFCINELELNLAGNFDDKQLIEKRRYLFSELNRPIRVCGMVVNEGHPGGGPFWVKDNEGRISKQVVEKNQVDLKNPDQKMIFEYATHFSPVDLVCGIKSYKGEKFNLKEFTDPDSGLITIKSYEGKELKALELPGLWNGGMAKWISVYVEVPKITFTPVKEVNDLLKEEHQPPK